MSPFAWTLFHLRGIPVRGHLSLLVVLPLLAFSIARDTLPFVLVHMDATRADLAMPIELLGLLLAFALFAAITAHELGHAAVTLRQGGRVRQITLMVFGGVAEIDHEDATPGQQITMALAGPAVSLALATISAGLSLIVWLPVDALAALRVGARPVFVDVTDDTLLMDPDAVARALSLTTGELMRPVRQARRQPHSRQQVTRARSGLCHWHTTYQ
jgi:Zn-dependent protease